MVIARFYNKNTKHLDFRVKLLFGSDCFHFLVHQFAKQLFDRSGRLYFQYLVYVKDGKVVAREASYLGVSYAE